MLNKLKVKLWIWKIKVKALFKSKRRKKLEQKEREVVEILIARQGYDDYYTMDSILDAVIGTDYDYYEDDEETIH